MGGKCLICKGITKKYSNNEVLKGIDLTIEPNKIYGLIGRNGAGKTTLLSILTAQNTCNSGTVEYDGMQVWENPKALENLCFSRELSTMLLFGQNTAMVKDYLYMASCYYPNWDQKYADRLTAEFNLNLKARIYKLSKGMLSMITIIVALASRAPITILDEPVAGLDVVMRDRFYDFLIRDYSETGRTFIISTHIIEEASKLIEEVIVLNDGVITEKENTEDLIQSFRYISGMDTEVDAVTAGLKIVNTEVIGRNKTVCVRLPEGRKIPEQSSLSVSPVSLQKIFVYLTSEKRGY